MTFVVLASLWFVAVGWVANDAARRQRSWLGWSLLVAQTSVLGLLLWLFARRRSPRTDVRFSAQRSTLLWIGAPLLHALIGAFVVTFLFQVGRIEGQAMAPTLNHHDRIIVNKMTYRFRPLQRGDIVMLRYPLDPQKAFVKRVIAADGDTIRCVDGQVFVNDVAETENYVPREARSHDTWGPHVMKRAYFVMGDRRDNSSDSRHWGPVPSANILGKVALRWSPDAKLF